MSQIDVADETWLATEPDRVAAVVADPANWRLWWPDLVLEVDKVRGPLGVRWFVHPSAGLRWAGSMEVWLEAYREGVVLHYFLRLDLPENAAHRARIARRAGRAAWRYRKRAKQIFWTLKDDLEAR
jgi:hypothetical protein